MHELSLVVAPWFFSGWSKHISPSSLGRAAACIRSEAMPHVHDNAPAARKGTVAHKFLADALEHGRDEALNRVEDLEDLDWLSAIDLDRLPASQQTAYEPEVAFAYNPQKRTSRVLGKNLSREQARAKAQDHEIVGIVDVLGQDGYRAIVQDYKTGWGYVEPAEVNWQLRTYALLAARWLEKDAANYGVIRVKENGDVWFDSAEMDELDLMAHEEALLALLKRRDQVRLLTKGGVWTELPPLVEGRHCRYCPALHACPAKVTAIRIIGTPAEDRALVDGPVTMEQKRAAWLKLKAARKTLDRYEAILKDLARQEAIPLDDGEVLGERLARRETIIPTKAREVLERQYGPTGSAVVGEAEEVKATLTKAALKKSLRKLILPTLPKPDQKITLLQDATLKLLREAGAVSATQLRQVVEWTPKATDGESVEETE